MAEMRRSGPADATRQDTEEALALYEQYARPLESKHHGQYVAVTPDGKVLLGDELLALTKQAKAQFGRGSYLFKLGDIAVGKWLCLHPGNGGHKLRPYRQQLDGNGYKHIHPTTPGKRPDHEACQPPCSIKASVPGPVCSRPLRAQSPKLTAP